ncbi:hypothetical protein [Acetivibrio straminisolvens]|uniref:hypothetical protein n=1 Tax=Acetivibrio straminisolvens TaxID=253314 RepID=UPI0026CC1FDE
MANYDDLKVAVEALTGGNNSVIFDVDGYPSIVVRFDKKQIADLITDGSASTHPAFIVNGVEVPAIYISKYQLRYERESVQSSFQGSSGQRKL